MIGTYQNEGVEVSTARPCLCCGGTDWCFNIGDHASICDRVGSPPEGFEQRGTAKDGRPIYIKIGTQYEPRPLSERLLPIQWEPQTDSPEWQPTGAKDGKHFEQVIEYFYPDPATGGPLGKVERKQWTDRRFVYGRGTNKQSKQIRPHHWAKPTPAMVSEGITKGWWTDRKGDATWPLYRQNEVTRDSIVFVVGGEQAVEAIRTLGGKAICNQGGEKTGRKQIVNFLKAVKPRLVVILPDNDSTGLEMATAVKKDLDKAYIKTIILDLTDIWKQIPPKGDIFDLLNCPGWSVERIRAELEAQIERLLEPLTVAAQLQTQLAEKIGFFTSPDTGLVWRAGTPSGEITETLIGNHLEAIGYCQSPTGDGAAVVLKFKTIHHQTATYLMPRETLAGDGSEIVAELMRRSYSFKRGEKNKLLDYLHGLGVEIQQLYVLNPTTGYVELNGQKSFVLPHATIGDEQLRFQTFEPPKDHPYQAKGTLESWQENVGRYATGNSRLVFGLSMAFGGPLLELLDLQGGGLNFYGGTSKGKTTAVQAAASVAGHPDKVVRSWRATDNGLEAVAAEHNNLTLILDELKECHPKVVDQASYLLANGVGKQRANRSGGKQTPKTWRLLFLSTGEMPFVDYLKGHGLAIKGGQEIRMIDVDAIAGEHGVFENLHRFKDGAALSNHLKSATRQHHGTALIAFLAALVERINNGGIEAVKSDFLDYRAALMPDGAVDPAVGRAIERFALVALAGELAIEFGVLPVPAAEPLAAAKTLLQTWLDLRGSTGSHDLKQALERVEALLRENYHSGLVQLDTTSDAKDFPKGSMLGYRKLTGEILILPSVYRDQLCQGVDRKLLTQELIAKGWLKTDKNDTPQTAHWVEGKTQRFYQFSIFWEDSNEQ